MRKFEAGQQVRVEHNARIVTQLDKNNPYWYLVEYPDGHRETVSIARINGLANQSRAVIDTDGSIQVMSPRLSAAGAIDLYEWLQTHLHDLHEALPQDEQGQPSDEV